MMNPKGNNIMKHTLLLPILIFLITSCSFTAGSQTGEDEFLTQVFERYPELRDKKYEAATVKRVIDGDTFETDSAQKVRLIGVNTPERHGQAQYYGREASDFSKKQLNGKKIYMFKDVSDTDKYNRLLRYVFIKDNPVMFNEMLLMEGYGNTMTIPPDVMFAEKFLSLERQARENSKGLWGESEHAHACQEPEIKGNINSRNEKIYHMPGGRYYDQTKAEKMFCTEEEAIAAGYRKSKQ
jgi:micrococcal nuclease